MDDWFKFGSKVGPYTVIRKRTHGHGLQRYNARDRTNNKPVVLTCAMPDRTVWSPKFAARFRKRAGVEFGPKLSGGGITEGDVFYLAEEAVDVAGLSTLPLHAASVCALMYAIGDELGRFAKLGFFHGALDLCETVWLSQGEPMIYGIGFRQILGVTDGVGVDGSLFCAPEILGGQTWGVRADVFGVCIIMAHLWRAKFPKDPNCLGLGSIGLLIKEGCARAPKKRPTWQQFKQNLALCIDSALKDHAPVTGFERALMEDWTSARPSSEAPSTARSGEMASKHANQSGQSSPMFLDWDIDPEGIILCDNVESYICRPFGADDLDLLRRVRITKPFDTQTFDQFRRQREKIQGVPRLVSAGVTKDGWAYWVEESHDSHSLDAWIKKGKTNKDRRLRAIQAVIAAGKALAASAKSRLLHGDLLPDRDLVIDQLKESVAVYGIGALQAFGLDRAPTSNPYAAPERQAGETFDHRADIWALAAILREALTRKGKDELEWWFVQFFEIALAANPEERFKTWDRFLGALDQCRKSLAAQTATMPAAPTTAPAQTPTSWTPSSNDPTSPPAPQGAPAAEPNAARMLELVVHPANENSQHEPKGMEAEAIDRVTMPSPLFVYPPPKAANESAPAPAKASRGPVWIASSVVLLAGVAASFAVLWSAGTPTLDSTPNTTQETQAFEAPIFRPTINTAEALRSTEKPRTKALEFEGVAYRFNERGECNEE